MKLGIYQHYKGNHYQVIGIARHTETLEELVVYQSLYADFGIWVRPMKMFQESIEYNGMVMPRFAFVADALSQAPAYQ